jgi:Spy/CpxP family protein refolding chaperone
MRKATITTLLLLLAVTLAVAQEPPAPPDPATRVQHQVQFLTTVLSLSSAQQQQATTIFTNAGTSESALHQQMKTARESLTAAVKSNNAAAIDQAAATIGSLTTQLTSIQAKAKAAFYQMLTADQQTKMSQLDVEGPRGFGGPGGHRHMGPGPAEPPPAE